MIKKRVIKNGKLSQSVDFTGLKTSKASSNRGIALRNSLNTAQMRRQKQNPSSSIDVQSYEIDHLHMEAVDEETILSSARPQLQLEKYKTITDPV